MDSATRRAPDPAFRNILVPLDGSELSAGALPTAHALAKRFGAAVHAVGVAKSDGGVEDLRVHAALALGVPADDPRVYVEVDEDVAGVIHHRADELGSSLVCMSTHGRGRVAGAVVGSVARAVIERGREPAVTVGPFAACPDPWGDPVTPPLAADSLVACVDGTPESERVLPVAAGWAGALRMRLTIVTVAEPILPPLRPEDWRRHHGPDADAEEFMRALAERWGAVAPEVDTEVVYDPTSAAAGMKDYLAAHPTGLVAVASHLRRGVERVALGAGAAEIVHRSTAPVLVVPIV